MKKILIFLILLFIPCLVLADSSSPMLTTYDVLVSSLDGAVAYESTWDSISQNANRIIIPFDTKLKVVYETRLSFDNNFENETDAVIVEYNSKQYALTLKDVTPYSKNVDLDKYKKEETQFYVYQDETNIYKGPSKTYGKIEGKIPKDTILTTKYYNNYFAYIEYEDISGWIFIVSDMVKTKYPSEYKSSVLDHTKKTKIMTVTETELIDKENNKITIPAKTNLSYEFGSTSLRVVNYNDKEYFLYIRDPYRSNENIVISLDDSKQSMTDKEIPIYNSLKEKEVIDTIPANQIVTINPVLEDYVGERPSLNYYINYNNIEGFVVNDFNEITNEYVSLERTISIDLYEKIEDEKPIKTISLDSYYEKYSYYKNQTWYYIESLENKGWIKSSDLNKKDDLNTPVEDNKDKAPNKNIFNNMTVKELVTYLVIGCFIISLTTFVTIKLVNKNKKEKVINNKEENNKEEVKKEDKNNEI